MKNLLSSLLLLFTLATFAQDWKPSLEDAKAIAAKENKNIILVFSGSDWCAPCINLDKAIWQSAEFTKEAATRWVMVRADFPKKKGNALPEAQKQENDKLAEKYNKEGNFPLVVIMDKTGKVLAKTGYKNLPPAEYIALLHSLENK